VVLAVEVDQNPQMVHNLEIADAHTYFAGELEAWGHNAKLPGVYYLLHKAKDYSGDTCDIGGRRPRTSQIAKTVITGVGGTLFKWTAPDDYTKRVWAKYLLEGQCDREGADRPRNSDNILNKIWSPTPK
jgi:hypothetical protein